MKHEGKVVIVTGAAQGLGLACVERFHAEGAKVLLVDVKEDRIREHVERLGKRAAWMAADLSEITRDMAADVVGKAKSSFGGVDVLVNNAGIIHLDDFVDFPEDAFDRVQRVNLKAPFLLGQAAAGAMIAQGRGGSIVNMSSINAILAIPNSVAYAVSKGGIKQLTAVMAVGLIPHNIRVNSLGPTFLETPMTRPFFENKAFRDEVLSKIKLGRLGQLDELTGAIVFLASDASSLMTGSALVLDGGWTAE